MTIFVASKGDDVQRFVLEKGHDLRLGGLHILQRMDLAKEQVVIEDYIIDKCSKLHFREIGYSYPLRQARQRLEKRS